MFFFGNEHDLAEISFSIYGQETSFSFGLSEIRGSNNQTKLEITSKNSKIVENMIRNFTITTNNGSYKFNVELLKGSSLVINQLLQENNDILEFHIDIDDTNNVMQKFEQMYMQKKVIFDKQEISTVRKITDSLDIIKCPEYMRRESIFANTNLNANIDRGVIMRSSDLERLFQRSQNMFTIQIKDKKYFCNKYAVLASQVIADAIRNDPSLTTFDFDFDDEFNEFEEFAPLFRFMRVQITPNNMDSLQKIAEELQVECILTDIDKYINHLDETMEKINDKQQLIDPIDELFKKLYNIRELTAQTVANSLLGSIWTKSVENVQELAACILQVAEVDFLYHPCLVDLLLILNKSTDKSNHLDALIPCVVKNTLNNIATTKQNCCFLYILYKKGIVEIDEILTLIMIKDRFIRNGSDNCSFGNNSFNLNEHVNAISWFFPELIEIKHIPASRFTNSITNDLLVYISAFIPDNIDSFKKIRDNLEPVEEITRALIHDDIDSFQQFITKNNICINTTKISKNIFDSFEDIYLIEYAAARGALKCFKYLLLNHAWIPDSIFQYAVFGGNDEIIRIIEQSKQFDNNNINNKAIIFAAIQKHNNDLFDWIFEKQNLKKANEIPANTIIFESAKNGNAHSLIECINYGSDVSMILNNMENEIIHIAIEKGFFRFVQLLLHFVGNINNNNSLLNKRNFNLIDRATYFGNLSIFKLCFDSSTNFNLNLANVLNSAVSRNHINIVKYIIETLNAQIDSFDSILSNSIQSNAVEIFEYIIDKFKVVPSINVLNTSCRCGNLKVTKTITDLILNSDPRITFEEPFYQAALYESDDICQYFLDKKVKLDFSYFQEKIQTLMQCNEDIIFLFLKNVSSDIKDELFPICLRYAINKNKKEVIEFLLNENTLYPNVLFHAVHSNDADIVRMILKFNSKSSFVNQISNDGTALKVACDKGNIEIIKLLLSIPGINPNLYGSNKATPLISAICTINIEIVNAILDFYGEKINSQANQINKGLKKLLHSSSPKNQNHFYMNNMQIGRNNNKELNEREKNILKLIRRLLQIKNIDPNCYSNNCTLLSYACQTRQIDLVQKLLQFDNIDVNLYNPCNGNTPLMDAIEEGDEEIIKLLLNNPQININQTNYFYQSALILAANSNQENIVKLILSNANFDPVESNINRAFYESTGPIAILLYDSKELNVNFNNCRNDSHRANTESTLQSCVRSNSLNDIEKLKLIITHPSFDPGKSKTISAILYAVQIDNIEAFKILSPIINYDLNCDDRSGNSLLIKAIQYSSNKVIHEILNNDAYDLSQVDILSAFIESFSTSNHSTNPFNVAIIMKDICEYDEKHDKLIDFHKLLPNGKSYFTSIHSRQRSFNIAEFFLNHGVDPNAPDKFGKYPLEDAILSGSEGIVQALVASGKLDYSIRLYNTKKTFLHLAATADQNILLIFLNNQLIDINVTDENGDTPLIEAVRASNQNNIRYLFNQDDLDYEHANKNNETAITISKKTRGNGFTFKSNLFNFEQPINPKQDCLQKILFNLKNDRL